MRRLLVTAAILGLLTAAAAVAPVSAKSRADVTMSVSTIFDVEPSEFSATIPGCSEGLTFSGGKGVFAPPHGNFLGYKLFDCGDDTGFLVRLNAHFAYDGSGSVGTWAIVDSWGALAGMSGTGKLTGEAIEGGVLDSYVGTITL